MLQSLGSIDGGSLPVLSEVLEGEAEDERLERGRIWRKDVSPGPHPPGVETDSTMANNRKIKKANHGKRPRCNKARKSKRLKA